MRGCIATGSSARTGRLRPHVVARAAQPGRDRLIRLDRAQARSVATLLARSRAKLDGQAKLLQTLGYHNVLARGFALVRGEDGAMLRRAAEVKPGAALDIEFADGHVERACRRRARKPEPEAKAPRAARRRKAGIAALADGERAFAKIVLEKREQAGVRAGLRLW